MSSTHEYYNLGQAVVERTGMHTVCLVLRDRNSDNEIRIYINRRLGRAFAKLGVDLKPIGGWIVK